MTLSPLSGVTSPKSDRASLKDARAAACSLVFSSVPNYNWNPEFACNAGNSLKYDDLRKSEMILDVFVCPKGIILSKS